MTTPKVGQSVYLCPSPNDVHEHGKGPWPAIVTEVTLDGAYVNVVVVRRNGDVAILRDVFFIQDGMLCPIERHCMFTTNPPDDATKV